MSKMNIKKNIVNTGVHPVENFLQSEPAAVRASETKMPAKKKDEKVRINIVVNREFAEILNDMAEKEMCSKTAVIVRSVLKYKENM